MFITYPVRFQGVRRLDLIPCHGTDNRSRSNSNSSYTQTELESIRKDEDDAFEWLEQQKNDEKEENEEGINVNKNAKKISPPEDEKNINDNENNENKSTKAVIRRNAALEFSLYLDENSTVDLYLELVSGVKKEIFEDDITVTANLIESKAENKDNNGGGNSNNGDSNGSNHNNTQNTQNKKTKFDSIDSDTCGNATKKRKIEDNVSTDILYNTTEDADITDLENSKTKLMEKISTAENNENSQKNTLCYNPKYFDKETHVRLLSMYEQAESQLNSLVMSEGMLMLMGYPGCDGEEGNHMYLLLLELMWPG